MNKYKFKRKTLLMIMSVLSVITVLFIGASFRIKTYAAGMSAGTIDGPGEKNTYVTKLNSLKNPVETSTDNYYNVKDNPGVIYCTSTGDFDKHIPINYTRHYIGDYSRMTFSQFFKIKGNETISFVLAKNGQAPANIIYHITEYKVLKKGTSVKMPKTTSYVAWDSNNNVPLKSYTLPSNMWVSNMGSGWRNAREGAAEGSYVKMEPDSKAFMLMVRYDNGDTTTGSGKNTTVGYKTTRKSFNINLNNYDIAAIVYKPFTYYFKMNGGTYNSVEKTSIKRLGINNVYSSISKIVPKRIGYTFTGWTVYAADANGNKTGKAIVTNRKADVIKKGLDGTTYYDAYFKNLVFEANWKVNTFTINYHKDDSAAASSTTTPVTYGTLTTTKTASDLKFSKTGYDFAGWKVYRECDQKWCYIPKGSTSASWLVKASCTGGSYYIYKNGVTVSGTATSGIVHFYGQWKGKGYKNTLKYNLNGGSGTFPEQTAAVTYPNTAKSFTITTAKPTKTGYTFLGWSTSSTATTSSYKPGGTITVGAANKATDQSVTLYAVWSANKFTVKYHLEDSAPASSKTTTVTYGVNTNILKLAELGFSKTGYSFQGWKAYREYDSKYFVYDSEGTNLWATSLPTKGGYYLYSDGQAISETTPSGIVHFYGQWKGNTCIIQYHENDSAPASSKTTAVTYGTNTKTLTYNELGFTPPTGKTFKGWKVYREYNKTYYVQNPSTSATSWTTSLPTGYVYGLYTNGHIVSTIAPKGIIHFYAQYETETNPPCKVTFNYNIPKGTTTTTNSNTTQVNTQITGNSAGYGTAININMEEHPASLTKIENIYYGETITADTWSAEGFEFLGWYSAPQYSVSYDLTTADSSKDTYTTTATKVFNADGTANKANTTYWNTKGWLKKSTDSVTLYAHYKAKKYNIFFDKNANDGNIHDNEVCEMSKFEETVSGNITTAAGINKQIGLVGASIMLPNRTTVNNSWEKSYKSGFVAWSLYPTTKHLDTDNMYCVSKILNSSGSKYVTTQYNNSAVIKDLYKQINENAITLYAIWDHSPMIKQNNIIISKPDLYKIKNATNPSKEMCNFLKDNCKAIDVENGEWKYGDIDFEFIFNNPEELIKELNELTRIGACNILVNVKDAYGNTKVDYVEIFLQPDNSEEELTPDPDAPGALYGLTEYTRSINADFFKTYKIGEDKYNWQTYKNYGGLRPTSIWIRDHIYNSQLYRALDNLNNGIYKITYKFSKDQVLAIQMYTSGKKSYDNIKNRYGEEKADSIKEMVGLYYKEEGNGIGKINKTDTNLKNFISLIKSWNSVNGDINNDTVEEYEDYSDSSEDSSDESSED